MYEKTIFIPTLLLSLLIITFPLQLQKQLHDDYIPAGENPVQASIPAYVFDWETADYMPTPSTHSIYVPWANGAVKGFPSDIWYDFKKSDGWELLFNQFNPNLPLQPNPFFVLYNKYRGLLRIYIYVTSGGFTNSDYLTDGLNLSPNVSQSHMLNYIGQDIVDVNNKQQVATKIEGTQIATGVWYAAQYEIAYDPAVATSSYQQMGLNWTLKWTNISTVKLEGDIQGSLKGTITTPASSFNLGSALMSGALQAAGLSVFSNNGGSDPAHPGTGNHLGLPAKVFEAAQDGLSGGLSGVVKNIFSGIFGGNSNNMQQVNLTLNAKITLGGSITGSGALIPDPGLGLGVPGTNNSQTAPGLIPYYNEPMGVVYITGKPAVTVTWKLVRTGPNKGDFYNSYTYTLNPNSFQVIYNPAVLNVATIENYKQEVLAINVGGRHTMETIGNYTALKLNANGGMFNILPTDPPGEPGGGPAVRISFDVVPNNGAPRVKIVKTFWATKL